MGAAVPGARLHCPLLQLRVHLLLLRLRRTRIYWQWRCRWSLHRRHHWLTCLRVHRTLGRLAWRLLRRVARLSWRLAHSRVTSGLRLLFGRDSGNGRTTIGRGRRQTNP